MRESQHEATGFASDIPALREALIDQRKYTLALYADLPSAYWEPAQFPYSPITNPPLWELAHIAWFAEFFCLRWKSDDVLGLRTPSILANADSLFNSQTVAHRLRWSNAYPGRQICLDYMQQSLDAILEALNQSNAANRYAFQLALVHEDMHAEALLMTLQALGMALPGWVPTQKNIAPDKKEFAFAGGNFSQGESGRSFRFDNEMPSQSMLVQPFSIASRVVSAAEFSEFANAKAYRDDQFWSLAGRDWRNRVEKGVEVQHEPYTGAGAASPAMHVNFYQACAWCRWAGRRLPTETEWEFAAIHSPDFFASTGSVWEWTASPFAPYPGFVADRYQEYSEPWFHTHQVLKGGSFVTNSRLRYPQYRNFYTPERRDVFAGFRTCALT